MAHIYATSGHETSEGGTVGVQGSVGHVCGYQTLSEDTLGQLVYNTRFKRQLVESVTQLSDTEHDEILKILKSHDLSFTSNKNGFFFNITKLPDAIITQLYQFVTFCTQNKVQLDEYDKKMNECKHSNYGAKTVLHKDPIKEESVVLDGWSRVLKSMGTQENDKMGSYIDSLNNRLPKNVKKKSMTKFNMAKKKFSKRVVIDKKYDLEQDSNLQKDEFLIL